MSTFAREEAALADPFGISEPQSGVMPVARKPDNGQSTSLVGALGKHSPLPLQSRKDEGAPVNGSLYQTIVGCGSADAAILADENL